MFPFYNLRSSLRRLTIHSTMAKITDLPPELLTKIFQQVFAICYKSCTCCAWDTNCIIKVAQVCRLWSTIAYNTQYTAEWKWNFWNSYRYFYKLVKKQNSPPYIHLHKRWEWSKSESATRIAAWSEMNAVAYTHYCLSHPNIRLLFSYTHCI